MIAEQIKEHGLENEAWNIMNQIYQEVRKAAPYVVNTTAWYDFGCPIILAALKKYSESKQ